MAISSQLEFVLESTNSWIRTADSKAAFIIGFGTLAMGWLVENGKDYVLISGTWGLALVGILLAAGVLLGALAVFPVLDLSGKPFSPIYFMDINERYDKSSNIVLGAEELQGILEVDWEKYLAEQVVVNSVIAAKKYIFLKWAFRLVILGFFIAIAIRFYGYVC